MNKTREIYLKLTIDWEDYDDVSDELIIEDVFENYQPKDGTNLEIVKNEGWNITKENPPVWNGEHYMVIVGWTSRSNPLKTFMYGFHPINNEDDVAYVIENSTSWKLLEPFKQQ